MGSSSSFSLRSVSGPASAASGSRSRSYWSSSRLLLLRQSCSWRPLRKRPRPVQQNGNAIRKLEVVALSRNGRPRRARCQPRSPAGAA